jgi:hypothetical protein
MRVNILAVVVLVAASLTGVAAAQDAPPAGAPPHEGQRMGRGMGAGFQGVGGQITDIEGSSITLQTFRGETAKVKITSATRLMKDGNDAKLADFKVGDRVFVAGEQGKDGVWTAQALGQRTGAESRGGAMGGPLKPEDNGKTYIFGEVAKIDGLKITVKKQDNTEQVIEVDDDTSFRNERRESVTLADVKVGDYVRGQGELKNGVFVPRQLNAGRPRMRQQGAPPAAPPAPASPPNPGAPPAAPDSSSVKK